MVELKADITTATLLGVLGGIVPFYCHGQTTWKNREACWERIFKTNQETTDFSNYLYKGLTPGIRVCGESDSDTSGLLVRTRNSGDLRFMVSNHLFLDTDEVYHPSKSPQNLIGEITHRYPDLTLLWFNSSLT